MKGQRTCIFHQLFHQLNNLNAIFPHPCRKRACGQRNAQHHRELPHVTNRPFDIFCNASCKCHFRLLAFCLHFHCRLQTHANAHKRRRNNDYILVNIGQSEDSLANIDGNRNRQETAQFKIAFCTCSRFSASSKIVSALASSVASSISLPRYAGRQCITSAPGLASFTSD
jgi:hypothetical protein